MKIRIRVTQEDIKYGEQMDEFACPMYLAIKRKMPNKYVEVQGPYIIIGNKQIYHKGIERFVHNFDESKKLVKPCSFIINI